MVELKNINRDNRFIWCDYFPESESKAGYIKVDLQAEEIVEHIAAPSESEERPSVYAYHAMKKLLDIQNRDPLPEISGAAWY